jgi:hypothetical protein
MGKVNKVINDIVKPLGFQFKKTGNQNGFWSPNTEFVSLYGKIANKTLVGIDKGYMIYQYARYSARHIPGDVAQLGVYRGGSAKIIAECFKNKNRKVYLFDTFEGLPEEVEEGQAKLFSDTDFLEVQEYLKDYPDIEFRKGFFPDTAKDLSGKIFSFVYLDGDMYESIRDGLNFFYPKLSPGGIILVDDYGSPKWTGVKKAVRELAAMENIEEIQTTWWQCLIIKPPQDK